MGIPIVIGVTGHRALREGDEPVLRAAVGEQLRALQKRYPASALKLLCSLAAGADMLCAEEALALGIPLACPLPLPVEDYETDFSAEDLTRFRALLARAESVFVAPAAEAVPDDPDRDFAYRQAGIYVAAHCHILLALWDGAGAEPKGCGAANAVDFHLRGAWAPDAGFPLRSADNGTVVHILTPRGASEDAAGTVQILGNAAAMDGILGRTEEFNRLAAGISPGDTGPLFPEGTADASLGKIEEVYAAADTLSLRAAQLYRRLLAALAAAATVLTLAFLLYDEMELHWMILVVGAMLLTAWGCRRYAVRSGCHRRYLEYRALAEGARVQAFLRFGGSGTAAASLFTWSQRDELAWVMDALYGLAAAPPPETAHNVRRRWVTEQAAYHAAAGARTAGKLRRGNRIVNAAFLVSIALYVAALAFELTLGARPGTAAVDPELCRTALKIVLGTLSAGTLFAANYYGKLSLPRQTADHEKMARFYAAVDAAIERQGQTERLLAAIAREELAENANWYAIQKDNTPDFSL